MSRVRVLYFGMPVEYSAAALRRLRVAPVEVCGVIVPQATGHVTLRRAELGGEAFILNHSAFSLAASGLPLIEVDSLITNETLRRVAAFKPDVICVACFPRLLPSALLALPPLGCLNLHPSVLPRYRGPAPLFWQFQRGEADTGVTVHFMDERADTGDIALQRRLAFPEGCTGEQADLLCGEVGGDLLIEALDLLAEGRCPRLPQSATGLTASAAPWPTAGDFELSPAWPARRAFNFVRATAHWGLPYGIPLGDRKLEIWRAVSFAPGTRLGAAWREHGGQVEVQFSDGVVRFVSQ
jgi:methionyl-tRNA formyltransferase